MRQRAATVSLLLLASAVSSVFVGACASSPSLSGNFQASARALVIQPDGKIALAGVAGMGNKVDFALARYLPDGTLDPEFGTGGKVITHFKESTPSASVRYFAGSYARAISLQSDGRLVAAGVVSIGDSTGVRPDYALARYHADGSLDRAFGDAGTVTTRLMVEQSHYNVPTLALQADGKLVVAGDQQLVGRRILFALVRYLPDGSLDPAFGERGMVATSFPASSTTSGYSSGIRALAIQPDRKLVAAGVHVIDGVDYFALARYLPDGSLDAKFGTGGLSSAVVAFGAKGPMTPGLAARGAFALALQPDGKLIAAGATEALKGRVVFAVARFLPDGSLDRRFGTDGTVATDFGDGGAAFALALQPDGKMVAAGATGRGDFANNGFALARYLPDGSLDRSFGVGGKVVSDFGWTGILALGLQPDGKLVAAGSAAIGDRRTFAVARYLSDGSLDSGFGVGGKVTTDFGGRLP